MAAVGQEGRKFNRVRGSPSAPFLSEAFPATAAPSNEQFFPRIQVSSVPWPREAPAQACRGPPYTLDRHNIRACKPSSRSSSCSLVVNWIGQQPSGSG